MTIVVAAAAGSIGALARYGVSGLVQRRWRTSLPVGTAAVNLLGALALGLILGAGDAQALSVRALAGFLGGFTTFSTWMVETIRLGALPRPTMAAVVNLTAVAAAGLALAAAGYMLAN